MEIVRADCSHCNVGALISLGEAYVIDDEGNRIQLKYPGAFAMMSRVLGDDYDKEKYKERVIHRVPMVCATCRPVQP